MTKRLLNTLRRGLAGAVIASSILSPAAASAEVLFSETFDYPAGNLYPQGGWLLSNHKTKSNPVKVTDTRLSFDNFISGKSLKLAPVDMQDEDVLHACVPRDESTATVTPITEGDIYAAFLINAQKVESKNYFFSLLSTNSAMALKNGAAPTFGPRVIAVPSENEGKFYLGFDKSSNNPTATSEELDLNTTYLVVLHYGIVEGTTNDVFEAWINPAKEKTTSTLVTTQSKADLSKGFVGVYVSQATGSTLKCPEMLVGPIRVATTWDELFENGDTRPVDPIDKAEITATMAPLPSGFALYQYQKYPVEVTVKAKNITDDISISGLGSGVKASVSTIPAAEALGDEGYKLALTIDASASTPVRETVTLTSGSAQASLPLSVEVVPVKSMMNFRFASSVTEHETYNYSNAARVTYVDETAQKIYMQDQVGGIAVSYAFTGLEQSPLKAGDRIKDLYLMATEPTLGVPGFELMGYFKPEGMAFATLVAENDFPTPVSLSLADLAESPDYYLNRLVTVSDLTFASAGETFTTAGTDVSSGSATGRVRPFANTNIIGTEIPAEAAVTGISTSASAAIITMRSLDDLSAKAGEPGLEISRELLVEATEYYPLGVATPFAKLTVKASDMPKPTSVWIGGKQRASFIADLDEIPAGTGEYTINISFKPTVTGRNEAMINFDASPTELSSSMSIAALAYDPDNMPEFTVDSSSLAPFSAAVGATQEQTLTIHAAHLLDYGNIRVLGEGNGAFRISSASFLKDGVTQLKVTFAPREEGSFSETIEFSAVKAPMLTVKVTGSTSGSQPGEEKQGDELEFDTSNPLAQYATSFDASGENNKPLSLAGWKNVALEGTRAFWSYTADGNTAAKVTAYDSKGGEATESPAEMLLLSPALDFTECPNRLLSFRIKGDFLTDDMTDQFSVLYIDPQLPEDERYQVIGGVEIPATADASGEWRDYIIDFDALDLADTFFIGFHYLSTRGRNTTAVYYVDDFSWGDTTVPFIRVDKTQGVTTAKVGEKVPVEEFTVTGLNLSENIAIAFEGADKDHFELSDISLPAEGGKFTVHYAPQAIGEHAVYVTLKSAGAPDTYLVAGGKADSSTGLDAVGVSEGEAEYYTLQGIRVYKPAPGALYIRVVNGEARKIVK